LRHIIKIHCAIFIVFWSFQLTGQEELVTDRPDATESANVMQPGEIQIEAGYSYERFSEEAIESTLTGVSALIRVGLFKQAELRLETGFLNQNTTELSKVNGLTAMTIGTKLNILNDYKNGFQLAFLGHLTLPGTGKEEFNPINIGSDFRLAAAKDLSDRVSVGVNIGMEWDGNSPKQTILYSVASGIGVVGDLGVFIEVFGFFPKDGNAQHFFNSGATYLISPDFQLDFGVGLGLNKMSSDLILTFGSSYRINSKSFPETL
jgi:hypothetical protein